MGVIHVLGGGPLFGSINVSGSKNAVLPMMAASLLSSDRLVMRNVPSITDVVNMMSLLRSFGVEAYGLGGELVLHAKDISVSNSTAIFMQKLRASVLVLGPLLARTGYVKMAMPGGCAIGERPIDFHMRAVAAMGAEVTYGDGVLMAMARDGLKGADIEFPNVSVGATENVLLAATLARGTTVLRNIAVEPEILELIALLRKMGGDIELLSNNICVVRGVDVLRGCEVEVKGDRIEAGTYAMAAAATGGEIEICGTHGGHNRAWMNALTAMGATLTLSDSAIKVKVDRPLNPVFITTRPYPYFPSDLQAQIAALALRARGTSVITETLYENRFLYVEELKKMGASIVSVNNRIMITGFSGLKGARVKATDLRAAGALIIAALSIEGESFIEAADYVDRGYQDIEHKLSSCGAHIKRYN